MDCEKFSHWLENRDNHDVSEADQALKYAQTCEDCQAKLQFDENLDKLIHNALEREEMPNSLAGKVDLSLAGMSPNRSRTSYRWFGAFSAMIAVLLVFTISLLFSPSLPTMDELGKHIIVNHTLYDDSSLEVKDFENIYGLGELTLRRDEIVAELPEGLEFVGARLCLLGDCEPFHLVFRQNNRKVSVYLIRADELGFSLPSKGKYSMQEGDQVVQFWQKGSYVFAMVG